MGRSGVVAQLADVLGNDTGIPDGMQTTPRVSVEYADNRITYLRRLPSKLNMAAWGISIGSTDAHMVLAIITASHPARQVQRLMHVPYEMDQEPKRNVLLSGAAEYDERATVE